MLKLRYVVAWSIASFLLPVLLLCAARIFDKYPLVEEEDYENVVVLAVSDTLQVGGNFRPGAIYLDAEDSRAVIEKLRKVYPSKNFLPWSSPTIQNTQNVDMVEKTPHEEPNRVSAQRVIFPLWNTALIEVGTPVGGENLILFKIGGVWTVLSVQRYVI